MAIFLFWQLWNGLILHPFGNYMRENRQLCNCIFVTKADVGDSISHRNHRKHQQHLCFLTTVRLYLCACCDIDTYKRIIQSSHFRHLQVMMNKFNATPLKIYSSIKPVCVIVNPCVKHEPSECIRIWSHAQRHWSAPKCVNPFPRWNSEIFCQNLHTVTWNCIEIHACILCQHTHKHQFFFFSEFLSQFD